MRVGCRVLAALVCASVALAAQEHPVTWSLDAGTRPLRVAPGQKFQITMVAEIEEGWHLYAMSQPEGGPVPTRISLPSGQPFVLAGEVRGPDAQTAVDPNFDIATAFYDSSASFVVPVKVADKIPSRAQTLTVEVLFQACNDRICLPKTVATRRVAVTIVPRPPGKSRK